MYWDLDLHIGNTLLRIALAMLFGAVIGIERQRRGQAAGVQTLMLVALGSAMFIVAAEEIIASNKDPNPTSLVLNVMAGVIGGAGFLGAGSIIHVKGRVEGITTAAAIWVTAGVGIICGLGEFVLAVIGGLATLLTLVVIRVTDAVVEEPIERDEA